MTLRQSWVASAAHRLENEVLGSECHANIRLAVAYKCSLLLAVATRIVSKSALSRLLVNERLCFLLSMLLHRENVQSSIVVVAVEPSF